MRKGTIFCIVGDNLGSHTIGGFNESFSSNHFCRFCRISKENFHENPLYNEELRNCENYESDSKSPGHCGVKSNSVFNSLNHFHVAHPELPPCLGHDLFEGIVALDIWLCLDYFVKTGWFTESEFNKILKEFKFKNHDSTDKPCSLNLNKSRLSGTAVQNWNLLRLLPLIILGNIPNTSDPVWVMLIQLKTIVEYVCAPTLHQSQVAYCQHLINEYLQMRATLFPNERLKPKHHYLRHYPWLMLQFGPLIHLWTLRFESKHSYFKKTARILGNYRNLEKTLSEKHQMLQAYMCEGNLFKSELLVEKYLPFDRTLLSPEIVEATQVHYLDDINSSFATSVTFRGITYKKDMFLLMQCNDNDDSIVVGKIVVCIIKNKTEIFFVVTEHKATFEIEFNLYCIKNISLGCRCVPFKSFMDFYPLESYDVAPGTYITLKHMYLIKY